MSEFKSSQYLNKVNMENQKKKAEETLDYIKNQKNEFFDGDEDFDALNECLSKYSKEDITKLDSESINKFKEELAEAGFELTKPENIKIDEEEYFKDMMIYFKESIEFEEKMTKMVDEYETDIQKLNAEVENVLKDYSNSIVTLMREEIANNPKFKDTKLNDLYNKIMESFDNSFTLDTVKDVAKQVNVQNTIDDYKRNYDGIHKQYVSVCKRLGIKQDISELYNEVQSKITDKYDEYPDFIIFLFMKYIAKRGSSVTFSKKVDGVFTAQLVTNLFLLNSDDKDEVIQNKFKPSCLELLDLYLG